MSGFGPLGFGPLGGLPRGATSGGGGTSYAPGNVTVIFSGLPPVTVGVSPMLVAQFFREVAYAVDVSVQISGFAREAVMDEDGRSARIAQLVREAAIAESATPIFIAQFVREVVYTPRNRRRQLIIANVT